MKLPSHIPFAAGLAAVASLGLAGCATTDAGPTLAVHGAVSLPADVKTIALSVTRPCPAFELQRPESAIQLARTTADDAVQEDARVAFILPVVYAETLLLGCVFGVSEGRLNASAQAIDAAAAGQNPAQRLAQMLTAAVNSSHPGLIHVVEGTFPAEFPPAESHLPQSANSPLLCDRCPRAPHLLKTTDRDVVVGLRVAFQGFRSRADPDTFKTFAVYADNLNPPLALALTVEVSVVRVRDQAILGGLTIQYESAPRKFAAWADDDATPLGREMTLALQTTLEQISLYLVRPARSGFAHEA